MSVISINKSRLLRRVAKYQRLRTAEQHRFPLLLDRIVSHGAKKLCKIRSNLQSLAHTCQSLNNTSCVHVNFLLMRTNLMHNRFSLIGKMLDINGDIYVFAFVAKIGIASTFITIFVQGVSGFKQFCTTGPIYIYHLKSRSGMTLKVC